MEELTAYTVTKSSTDGTFSVGDVIWMSENGDINCIGSCKWISPSDCTKETLDFEFQPYAENRGFDCSEQEVWEGICM